MSETITLELPANVVRQARTAAAASNRKLEVAMVDWIERAVRTPSVESLSNEDLLAACDAAFASHEQQEFSDLLSRSRDEEMNATERDRLNALQTRYREGTIQKARALKEAVFRSLRPRLTGHAP